MKKYFLPVLLCFVILIGVNFVFGSDTPVQQIVINPITHVGQPVDNLVTLESYTTQDHKKEFCKLPIPMYGEMTTYIVPDGFNLVVTDIDIVCFSADAFAGDTRTVYIRVKAMNNQFSSYYAAVAAVDIDSEGRGSVNISYSTGFVVYSNSKLELEKDSPGSDSQSVIINGYLVPDPTGSSGSYTANTPTAAPTAAPTITPAVTPSKEETSSSGIWTGTWDTDLLGKLVLKQDGNTIKGSYNNYDGSVEGTTDDNKLTGKWESWYDSGEFEFTISEDGKSFSGNWKSKSELKWKTINGTKK